MQFYSYEWEDAFRKAVGIIILGFLLSGNAQAANLEVCPSGCAYSSIQDAINASANGYTISVQSGTYFENVNVTKKLTLRGIGNPVVDANRSGNAITLSVDGITLEGFTATGSGFGEEVGIRVTSNNNTLIRNHASNNPPGGIYISYSNNNTLSDNTANESNYGDGIYLFYSNNNTLNRNTALNNFRGICLSSSNYNALSGNNASNGKYGISIGLSNNNTLGGNNVLNNGEYGILLGSSTNNTLIRNNVLNNGGGISGALDLHNSSNNTIIRNNVSNNYNGFFLESSSNNVLNGNNVNLNIDYSIRLISSNKNTIYDNYFSSIRNALNDGNNIWNTTKTEGINIIGGPYLGGNYWGNPEGTGFSQTCGDENKDGICDLNYTFSGVDYLPLTIPSGYGYVYGTVLNDSTGIAGAVVSTNTSNATNTDSSGLYSLLVPAGTYNLTASSEPVFYPNSPITVTAANRTTLMQDIELLKKPTGNISGIISSNIEKLTGNISGTVSAK